MDYEELIHPARLFKNAAEVEAFCDIVEDPKTHIASLQQFLQECEDYELYEYCSIIKKKIHEHYASQHNNQGETADLRRASDLREGEWPTPFPNRLCDDRTGLV